MTTLFLTHPACLLHRQNDGHPESPERLKAVLEALDRAALPGVAKNTTPDKATRADLALVHDTRMIEEVFSLIPGEGFNFIDNDTLVSAHSGEAALHAVGAVLEGVRAVAAGEAENAFCAVRPPGHHAHRAKSAGFCLFNNLAIGVQAAIERHGLKKVAIVDFDVHHGDGTQDIFWDRPDVLFISTHQSPLYPFTGAAGEKGSQGNVMNIPLPAGTGGPEIRRVMREIILPALNAFRPEILFISAGYDSHQEDPIGGMRLSEDDYAFMMHELRQVAKTHAGGKLVAVLEGGYNVTALADSVIASLEALSKDE